MSTIKSKYGYHVGEIVQAKQELSDERMKVYPAGTLLRIVAISPKVTMARFWARTYPLYYDNKEYFFNAVLSDQDENYYASRIRADFCTIQKVKG